MLRVSMFDAGKMIMEGMKGFSSLDDKGKKESFMRRNDAYFTDYGMMGLLVHQNYPKIMSGQFLRTTDLAERQDILDRAAEATETMSDFGLMENMVRGGDQHWELLTATAALSVRVGSLAGGPSGGFLPGFPEFPQWLGKNSSKGKHERLLAELQVRRGPASEAAEEERGSMMTYKKA
jgi:replication factor C subunit 1